MNKATEFSCLPRILMPSSKALKKHQPLNLSGRFCRLVDIASKTPLSYCSPPPWAGSPTRRVAPLSGEGQTTRLHQTQGWLPAFPRQPRAVESQETRSKNHRLEVCGHGQVRVSELLHKVIQAYRKEQRGKIQPLTAKEAELQEAACTAARKSLLR